MRETNDNKDLVRANDTPPNANPRNPFERQALAGLSAGAVTIEAERAIAEVQARIVVAKRFPRDRARAFESLMDECSRPEFAREATYKFPRGNKSVTGASIRLAEAIARYWGNIEYGLRELSRRGDESEMEAYAWDLETNAITRQTFTAKHIRDKTEGGQKLESERDIYEHTANLGSRRVRARILALVPGDIEEAALAKCRATMAGDRTLPLADRIQRLVETFAKFGVKVSHLEKRLQKPVGEMLPDELADYNGIGMSIRDGFTKPSDWFGNAALGATGAAAAIEAAAGGKKNPPPPPPPKEPGFEDGDPLDD